MEDENKEKNKIHLNIDDATDIKDNIEQKPSKEDVEKLEKTIVLFLLDLQKSLKDSKKIIDKLGFKHLSIALSTPIATIDVYLEQYKIEKGKK